MPVEREIPHGALHEPAPPGQCLDNKGFVPRSTCAVCLTVQSPSRGCLMTSGVPSQLSALPLPGSKSLCSLPYRPAMGRGLG